MEIREKVAKNIFGFSFVKPPVQIHVYFKIQVHLPICF